MPPAETGRANLSIRRGFQAARIKDPDERRRYIAESASIDANPEGIGQKTAIQDNLQTRSELLGSMKRGGNIHRTGAYLLHKGEHVVPKKKNRWMQGVEKKHSKGKVGQRARLALAFASAKH